MKRLSLLLSSFLVPALGAGTTAPASPAMDHGDIALSDLVVLLGGQASSRMARTGVQEKDTQRLRWFTDTALADPHQRNAAAAAFLDGQPVAILRGASSTDTDRILHGLFGVASQASTAVYQRNEDNGGIRINSVDLPDPEPETLQTLAAQLRDALLTARRTPRANGEAPTAEQVLVPEISFSENRLASSGNGSALILQGTLTRSVTRYGNTLTLTLKTTHTMRPHQNGLHAPILYIPARYVFSHSVGLAGTPPETVKLAAVTPQSDSRTDLDISEVATTTTSFGLGASAEVSSGLGGDKAPNYAAKLTPSFNFNYQHAVAKTVAFTITDYSVANASTYDRVFNTLTTQWTMPLADAIAGSIGYFGYPPSIRRMTPSMRQAMPQAVSEWRMPGSRKGPISISSDASIINQRISGLYPSTQIDDTKPQPRIELSVDVNSPYLSPEPTVFIQSKAGSGKCLREDRTSATVKLTECPDLSSKDWIWDTTAQWQFDADGRYFNRASGKCMHLLSSGEHGDGQIVTRPCSISREQRWEWQADRIHSLHGDGNRQWRLYQGSNGELNARTDGDPQRQTLPVNGFHALLKPWSSYPNKPSAGDFIPKLENLGQNQPIPPHYLNLAGVSPVEQWELIVLRQSLMRE